MLRCAILRDVIRPDGATPPSRLAPSFRFEWSPLTLWSLTSTSVLLSPTQTSATRHVQADWSAQWTLVAAMCCPPSPPAVYPCSYCLHSSITEGHYKFTHPNWELWPFHVNCFLRFTSAVLFLCSVRCRKHLPSFYSYKVSIFLQSIFFPFQITNFVCSLY